MNKPKPKVKITIKPLPQSTSTEDNKTLNNWKTLERAIDEIFKRNSSHLSYEELYRNAYHLVIYKNDELLFNNTKDSVSNHLAEIGIPVLNSHNEVFIECLKIAWDNYKTSINCIKDVLMYLDKQYSEQGKQTVLQSGIELFKLKILYHEKVRERFIHSMMQMIKNERNGENIDKSILKEMVEMLLLMGLGTKKVYQKDFETYFLQETESYYETESQYYISSFTVSEYLKKVDNRIKEERERINYYLDNSSSHKIESILDKELLESHKNVFFSSVTGLNLFLLEDKINDLSLLYKLMLRLKDGTSTLMSSVAKYIEEEGKATVERETQNKDKKTKEFYINFVEAIIKMKIKYDRILTECFQSNPEFNKAFSKSFESFMNLTNKTSHYIVLYLDEKLKKGGKGGNDDELVETFKQIIQIFRYLQDKDVFEKYYKTYLSKRLISNTSTSEDMERIMIGLLKMECGNNFTQKLEGMFTDMKNNAGILKDWQKFFKGKQSQFGELEFTSQVLTLNYWPFSNKNLQCNLPQYLNDVKKIFEVWYCDRHDGRKLLWHPGYGNSELRCTIGKVRRTVSCSTYQMALLLLFTDVQTTWTYKDLKNETAIPDEEMLRHLLAFCGKKKAWKILDKTGDKKTLNDDDVFTINPKWKPKLRHVVIGKLGASKEIQKDSKEAEEKIMADREIEVDACIVRVMKARKTLQHNMLMNEVIQLLVNRFVPSPSFIKQRIQSLISRDYLERSSENQEIFNYLA
eukprot:TRINITY_DN4561_c0_g1_i1.p1 TRINITY_DN4561_c0_g1~~TRINITY_DN4561_c0_g1_i1.p1  ORF type:complete len:746 (-),score=260.77 TRINITY_DN4561_c0_g1_i1:27-2264(-)